MAAQTPPPSPSPSSPAPQDAPAKPDTQNQWRHNAALAVAIISPLAMLLPPRKFDLRFAVLTGTFSLSTDQLARDYTGRGIYERFRGRVAGAHTIGLPAEAERTKQLLRRDLERRAAVDATARAELERQKRKERSPMQDFWEGGNENWRQERIEEERRAREEGKGVMDRITDQIAEVWRDPMKAAFGSKSSSAPREDEDGDKSEGKKSK